MDFSQLVKDLKMLEGLTLQSIRPGAELTIEKVDIEQGKILISSKNKRVQSRPLSEFQKLWDELCASPAIHVDEVLHGSGSSRNQPETILANLPYIEWLKINNKKHIAYVGTPTHSFGTIKRMDASLASAVSSKYLALDIQNAPVTLIVSDNIAATATSLTNEFGKSPVPLSEGIYEIRLKANRILLASSTKISIPCGIYIELKSMRTSGFMYVVNIGDARWGVYSIGEINAITPL